MAEVKNVTTPLTDEVIKDLHRGDMINISGVIYTGRDAAHQIMVEKIAKGEELPVDFHGQVIYYAGPTPAKPGKVIGSCGPTTSGRMDAYSPRLLDLGQPIMIGKGKRNGEVKEAIRRNGAVYLAAVGGAGALMAASVQSVEIICWDDLGCEAVRKMEVKDFPLTVVIDSEGNDLYEQGPAEYKKSN